MEKVRLTTKKDKRQQSKLKKAKAFLELVGYSSTSTSSRTASTTSSSRSSSRPISPNQSTETNSISAHPVHQVGYNFKTN